MKTAPYSPPPGRFDLPFTWAINTGGLANGSNAIGQSIYLIGGFGDFISRRAVGMNRILAADGTGAFQINRSSRYDYLSADPIQGPNSPELAITPEQFYRETGQIRFDLYGIDQPANLLTSQLAFQGVRRQRGGAVTNPNYKAFRKTFTYQCTANLPAAPSNPTQVNTAVNDYDFQLEQLIILADTPQQAHLLVDSEAGSMNLVAVTPGASGNSITIAIVSGAVPVPTISVVGNAITITTESSDFAQTQFVVNLINSTPAAAALVTASVVTNPLATLPLLAATPLAGGAGGTPAAITSPVCAVTLYDWVKIATSNIPILDIFMNGGPGSPYENGALVPPLWYPNQSSIQMDFTPLTDAPVSIIVYFVGKQFYPCA